VGKAGKTERNAHLRKKEKNLQRRMKNRFRKETSTGEEGKAGNEQLLPQGKNAVPLDSGGRKNAGRVKGGKFMEIRRGKRENNGRSTE